MQLDNEYQARLRGARMAPGAGVEERMALYRQEVEEQAAAEVARQVGRTGPWAQTSPGFSG